jgi:hypothetical protein
MIKSQYFEISLKNVVNRRANFAKSGMKNRLLQVVERHFYY